MPFLVVLIVAIVGLATIPSWWVKRVIQRHGHDRPDFPGSGGAFARYLLDGMKLTQVKVEETQEGDHYHPADKAVRLSPEHFSGRSLSAVVIAAHEVGHAMQDATDYAPLRARTRMAVTVRFIQKIGSVVMFAAPVLMIVTRSPYALFADYAAGAMIMLVGVVMHAVTLPVEFDASFRRALPLLEEGRFISERDMPAARQILKAAAFTYVASAAVTLLSITRWIRILRF